jgi:hypothetical protein
MLCHVALVRSDVSEERRASIIRVTRIGVLGTMLAITSNRHILRRNTILTYTVYYYYTILYCHVYQVGSVTNNTTRVRIGYRIYSLWRFTTAN